MKKILLTALSVCAFLSTVATANAQEAAAKKHHNEPSVVDAKETSLRAEIEKNSACQNILNECKKLGFVAGGFKEGNGLWRNCFNNVVAGKAASLKGKDVSVAANANDVSSCKAVVQEVRKEKKEAKGKAHDAKNLKAHEATAPAAKQ